MGGAFPADRWPNQFFLNESTQQGAWTKLRLRGHASNYYGVGARIRVVAEAVDGSRVARYARMDNKTGFGSAPYVAHVGLGNAKRIVTVEVFWPGEGEAQQYSVKLGELNLLEQDG